MYLEIFIINLVKIRNFMFYIEFRVICIGKFSILNLVKIRNVIKLRKTNVTQVKNFESIYKFKM